MTDLFIYENNGDGGDLLQQGNNLATISGLENQAYLACMGGAEDGSAWWADKVFFAGKPSQHFVSQTMLALNTTPITSAGRIKIEQAIKNDLAYLPQMLPGTSADVSVVIESDLRLKVTIAINGYQVVYYWFYQTQELAGPTFARSGVGFDIVESTLIVY